MADWSKPTLTSTYTNFLSELNGRLNDLAVGMDTSATNIPTNTIRWSSTNNKWQKWNGSAWVDLSTQYAVNVYSATRWTTGRTISLTGDVSGTSSAWDGSANLSFSTTLATVNSNVGTYGSSSAVPVITVDAKGRVTAVSTAALASMAVQSSSNVNITGGSISGVSLNSGNVTITGGSISGVSLNSGNVTITGGSISGLSSPLPIASGGTGATTSAGARSALGAAASGSITASGLTQSTNRLLGRASGGTGAVEEIALDNAMALSEGVLIAKGRLLRVTRYTTPGSGTWYKQSDTRKILIRAAGGGGGGAGGWYSTTYGAVIGGGGGGGGGFSEKLIDSPAASYAYTVGAGGAGSMGGIGTWGGPTGSNGGATTIAGITAGGGGGATSGGIGGSGGSSAGGDFNVNGSNGGSGAAANASVGVAMGGGGGLSRYGMHGGGGSPGGGNNNGTAGLLGGGGGGGGVGFGVYGTGGNGGAGYIEIWEFA